jgi:oxygen-independent coproporphyrinogen-3 oxidase
MDMKLLALIIMQKIKFYNSECKNRKLQRNFQGYTEDDAEILIGIGASSISSLPNGYVQNITLITDYIRSLKKNKLPISRGYD